MSRPFAAVYRATVQPSPYLAANNHDYYVTENNDSLCIGNIWSRRSWLIGVDMRWRTSESVFNVKLLFGSTNF
jgi:hypothetical protein